MNEAPRMEIIQACREPEGDDFRKTLQRLNMDATVSNGARQCRHTIKCPNRGNRGFPKRKQAKI